MKSTKEIKEIKAAPIKAAPIKATPLYKGYLTAFDREGKAITATGEKIRLIAATGLTLPEFFTLLWSEKFKVPEQWPLNSSGSPLSPTSSKTRAAVPEVNRLVSALAMQKKRKKDVGSDTATDSAATATDSAATATATDSAATATDNTGTNIESFDKDACIGQLQALLVQSFEVEEDIYKAAKKLVKLLIDRQ